MGYCTIPEFCGMVRLSYRLGIFVHQIPELMEISHSGQTILLCMRCIYSTQCDRYEDYTPDLSK